MGRGCSGFSSFLVWYFYFFVTARGWTWFVVGLDIPCLLFLKRRSFLISYSLLFAFSVQRSWSCRRFAELPILLSSLAVGEIQGYGIYHLFPYSLSIVEEQTNIPSRLYTGLHKTHILPLHQSPYKEPQQKSSVIKIGIRSILSSEQQQKAQAEARSREKKEKREPSNFLRRSANSPGLSKDEKTKEKEEQDREKHAN